MQGIGERDVQTARLRVHVRESGSGTPVVFLHGNCSAGGFYEDLMRALPAGFRAVTPDLRGYGATEPLPVDATRGCGDWADDLQALKEALGLGRFHVVGWSAGGGVAMRYALDHAADLLSITLIDPMSPCGFGGTKDVQGTLCFADAAGSGGGLANPEFVQLLAAGERGAESANAPRNVMNNFYFKPPFRGTPEQEERWLDAMNSTRCAAVHYPGDSVPSANWPGLGPGTTGFNNAYSPKYHNVAAFAAVTPQPPVLWVRGDSDQIVSDTSFFDLAFLGSLGYVPGWPGAELCPPQPMVGQMRAVLDDYRARGGHYEERVIADAGHAPFIEQPAAFQGAFFEFLRQTSA